MNDSRDRNFIPAAIIAVIAIIAIIAVIAIVAIIATQHRHIATVAMILEYRADVPALAMGIAAPMEAVKSLKPL